MSNWVIAATVGGLGLGIFAATSAFQQLDKRLEAVQREIEKVRLRSERNVYDVIAEIQRSANEPSFEKMTYLLNRQAEYTRNLDGKISTLANCTDRFSTAIEKMGEAILKMEKVAFE